MRIGSLLPGSLALLALGIGSAQAAPWVVCGNLSTLSPVTCQIPGRPSTVWEYAIAYNTAEPVPVVCTSWNLGARIANKEPYLVYSDNPSVSLRWGGFVFYQNTAATDDDACATAGGYRHRYWVLNVNNGITTGDSNGCYTTQSLATVYCRRR
ncbi:MAG: hypothetical protein AB7I59_26560 [Geminicoccaceae bacterium]